MQQHLNNICHEFVLSSNVTASDALLAFSASDQSSPYRQYRQSQQTLSAEQFL